MEFRCEVCGKTFVTDWEAKDHGAMHGRGPPPQGPRCSACGGQFASPEELAEHAQRAHPT